MNSQKTIVHYCYIMLKSFLAKKIYMNYMNYKQILNFYDKIYFS